MGVVCGITGSVEAISAISDGENDRFGAAAVDEGVLWVESVEGGGVGRRRDVG